MAEAEDELRKTAAAAFRAAFGGVIRIEPEGAAPFWIDGRVAPPTISDGAPGGLMEPSRDAVGFCSWFASEDTLLRVFEEERLLANSFVSGRLAIAGDMSVMARLELARARG